jgi:hypothetical protein
MEKKPRVTPERAVDILSKHGVKVTLEQAAQILAFMEKFAQIAIDQYMK